MASLLHTVADGVRATLAAGTFTIAVTPQLSYETEMLLSGLIALRCDVVPATAQFEASSRSSTRYEFGVDVGLRKKFGTADGDTDGKVKSASVAALIELLEDMNEYLANSARRRFSATYASAIWRSSGIRFLWIPDHLRENHQYTGIFRVNYSVEVDET